MKKISLLFIVLSIVLSGYAQKIRKAKLKLSYQLYPLVNLPDSTMKYFSNDVFLKFHDMSRVPNGGYNIFGEIYPMYKLKEDWGKPHTSQKLMNVPSIKVCQPFKVVLKDSQNDSIYYRIFNYVEEIPQTKYQSIVSDSEKMDKFGKITDHLDLLFTKRKTFFNIKLFWIDKSDNYKDVNKAYKLCVDGIAANEALDINKRNELFVAAIDIFENILNEAQLNNKKARINKKIAEAVVRNLVQILPFVNRVERTKELNKELLHTYRGMSNAFFANKAEAIIQSEKYNAYTKEGGGNFSFSELELKKEVKPHKNGELHFYPKSSKELEKMLVGSWRYFYESYYFPKDIEKDKLVRQSDTTCQKESLLHFDSRNNFLEQEGSWEIGCKQKFDNEFSKWKVLKDKESGDMYIAFAFDEEDMKDPMEFVRVLHISQNLLVIKGSTRDGDTTRGTVVQFQRAGLVEK